MEGWEPHTVTSEEAVDPGPVAALAALFDDGLPTPRPGDELPTLWHWVALPRWPVSEELGPDGHPRRGSFLPPVELPRRMFAGGEVTLHHPLRIGETLRRESRVDSVTEKTGRSGRLVVVVVATRLFAEDGTLGLEERQNLIYRESGEATSSPPSAEDVAALSSAGCPFRRAGDWSWEFTTDPTLLMRFSAATANPHRIHYDWPYATHVEGYPGLVVHGPLMTLALAELLRLEHHPGRVRRLRHHNRTPLYCGQPAQLVGQATTEGIDLDLLGLGGEPARRHTSLAIELQQEGSCHA
jgi:3-methylfumaryl-CoA hydratase